MIVISTGSRKHWNNQVRECGRVIPSAWPRVCLCGDGAQWPVGVVPDQQRLGATDNTKGSGRSRHPQSGPQGGRTPHACSFQASLSLCMHLANLPLLFLSVRGGG